MEQTIITRITQINTHLSKVDFDRREGLQTYILRVKELLRSQSKETVGFGPTVQFDEACTRRFGAGDLPGAVTFDTLEDLTRYISREAEAERILKHARIVAHEFPAANAWTATRLNLLSEGDAAVWHGITKVVAHFIKNPKPWIYPREVLLGLHTKFLEQNHRPIIEILAEVAPATLNECYTNWQDRLGLRSSSDLVEGRFLEHAKHCREARRLNKVAAGIIRIKMAGAA